MGGCSDGRIMRNLMCEDFVRAEQNRRIISEGLFVEYWIWLRKALQVTPIKSVLPKYIHILTFNENMARLDKGYEGY